MRLHSIWILQVSKLLIFGHNVNFRNPVSHRCLMVSHSLPTVGYGGIEMATILENISAVSTVQAIKLNQYTDRL